ncbi:MAG: gamma-glutamylcyclotransferase [Proteobacteria bacterium]|nr:gamma-glutamylcyclotransferase [Pseudomonadota bacterium]
MPVRHIAFYGLLLPGQGPFEAFQLGKFLKQAGPCTLRGKLYDVGGYPGLVPGEGQVYGNLFEVTDQQVFRRLDVYEEYNPKNAKESECLRRPMPLIDPRVSAWIYVFNRAPSVGKRLHDGRWRPELAANGSRLQAAYSHRAGRW